MCRFKHRASRYEIRMLQISTLFETLNIAQRLQLLTKCPATNGAVTSMPNQTTLSEKVALTSVVRVREGGRVTGLERIKPFKLAGGPRSVGLLKWDHAHTHTHTL